MSTTQASEIYRNLGYYCDCFSKIKVYKNQNKGGEALNQPILLLSVIDLMAEGSIKGNIIQISDNLVDTFKKYWLVLCSESFEGSDFALPFFHLKNAKGKFWRLKFNDNYEGGRPQTIPTLKRDVNYAILEDELFDFLQDANARQELIDAVVAAWFSSKGKAIEDILQVNQDFNDSTSTEQQPVEDWENYDKQPKIYLKKSVVINAFFRKAVVHLYDYKCAFCRLKVTKSLIQNIVDGAHIKPFSRFYDSKVDNGISLCKNHHWAFDQGLFTIKDDYKIIISKNLDEDSPNAKPIKNFEGEIILLPSSEKYFPRLEAIKWHRKNVFKT